MTQEKQDGGAMDDLFTLTDAKQYLGVAINTLKLYALRGRLPYIETAGGLKLFRREDLDRVGPMIEANRRKKEEGE